MQETISYSEENTGWTSFWGFIPDAYCKLNNRFFTIKDGQLWLHNDESNPIRNNFYGEQFNSKIVPVINEANSEDKIFKTLALESTHAWKATIKTNYTESTIESSEFNKRESRFFSHIRKNEDQNDLHGSTAQGIGNIVSSTGLTITFDMVSDTVSIGDILFQVNGSVNEQIGVISLISNGVITVDSIVSTPIDGSFSYATKNARIEGSEIRGYYAEVELENSDTEAVELFAIESNIVKSYV